MAAKPKAKRGQQLVGEVVTAAGTKALVQRGTENWSRNRLVDRRRDRPAPFAGIRDTTGKLLQVWTFEESGGGQVKQPGGDDAAATPDLRDIGQIQIIRVILGVAQRGGFRVGRARLLAGVGVA